MKKLLKPEMEFIKFNTEDVITTSGGDTYNTGNNEYTNTDANAKDAQNFGGLQWNMQ